MIVQFPGIADLKTDNNWDKKIGSLECTPDFNALGLWETTKALRQIGRKQSFHVLSWGKASRIWSNDLMIMVGLERIRHSPGSRWNIHGPSCLTSPSVYDGAFFATVHLDVQRAVEESNPAADH